MSAVSSPTPSAHSAIIAKGKFSQIETDSDKGKDISLLTVFRGIRAVCAEQVDTFVSVLKNLDDTDSKRAIKAAKEAGFVEKLFESVKLYAQVKWELLKSKIGEFAAGVVKSLNLDVSIDGIQKKVDSAIENELETKLTAEADAAAQPST